MSYKKDNLNKYDTKGGPSGRIDGYKQGINDNKVFSKRQIEFVVKRTEKLSSAVYIITDLISDKEPLKWKLRQTSLSLLSDISGHKLNISENIHKMVSFLDIALIGNIMSEMNGSVLKREFEELIKIIDDIKSKDIIGGLFLYEKNEINALDSGKSKGHDKGHININVPYKTNISPDMDELKGHNSIRTGVSKKTLEKSSPSNDKQKRRMIILDTTKKKKVVTVRDIAALISDCSEKTLQRELVSMVKDKILKKSGDKRWSKYSLC